MDIFLRLAGTLIVLVVLQDVFFTVLFPASGRGIIRKPLSDLIWNSFRLTGRLSAGRRRRELLANSGPTLITVTLAVWFLLLTAGWAMIYKPALGTGILASSGPTDTGWATALYYSGFNLTTLGVGDMAPKTGPYKLLAITEAAVGVAFFSMVITYFLSVYSSLTSRNAFAQGLHHRTRNTGDAAELLARLAHGSDLPEARQHLSSKAEFLRRIYQTHRFYPVLRYFHYREPYYALPRILLTALDTATLLRSALDEKRYSLEIQSAALDELLEASLALMNELIPGVEARAPSEEEASASRKRYADAIEKFNDVGLVVRADIDKGVEEYVALRAKWHHPLYEIAKAMIYEWTDTARPFR